MDTQRKTVIGGILPALLIVILTVIAPMSACADETTTPDSRLEMIEFRAPAGWTAADKGPGSKVYTAPDSTADRQAVILLFASAAQPNLNFRGTFDAVAKQMTSSGKMIDPGNAVTTKSRQGYDAISQNFITEMAGGERVYVRLVAVNVNNRLATFCYLASGGVLYTKHTADMDNLLQSVRFDTGAANPERPSVPAPMPAAPAVPATGIPANQEDAALAKAIEAFNAGKDARRKPHTVVGTILTLDGRPIPNIVSCSVQISGFTIAAERASFSTEPDKNGQYELQVPDGLYRVFVTCVVSVQGRNVPIDIMPIDGKATRVSESSSPGIVQDFRLVMAALQPGLDPNRLESYYGGVVSLSDPTYTPTTGAIANRHPGAKLRLSFKPEGLAVDGSRPAPFALDLDVGRISGNKLYRIPIAVYHVTGVLIAPDGSSTPVRLSNDMLNNYGDTVDVYWESVKNYANPQRTDARIYVRD